MTVSQRVLNHVPGSVPEDWQQHSNGGGWVHKTAKVEASAYLYPTSIVGAWAKIQSATTVNDLRQAIVEELNLRAWQERAVSTIGRTTKQSRAAHEHAAEAFETLATQLAKLEARQ